MTEVTSEYGIFSMHVSNIFRNTFFTDMHFKKNSPLFTLVEVPFNKLWKW